MAHGLDLRVTGLEHVPRDGPAILVARHYHHLYDACAILASVPREVHVVVAVDWLHGWPLQLMLKLTQAARWPAVWRSPTRLNRSGYQLSLELLRRGRLLLIFPEGYPAIEPRGLQVRGPAEFLPFASGFLRLAERAGPAIPIVPVGLWYGGRGLRQARLRFGKPLLCSPVDVSLAAVETAVRE
ncbi:MAG: 1-acyl-sn-glycerol-3-phosphate acyltransferase, partial [Chloroflexi bacterium]|nr:1-acyl-sn-glycerol-3-phosphate acyltransferase [Chloroflexota bacterium]